MTTIPIEYPTDWTDYELIDSGQGEKLERFGPQATGYTIVRPDPRALWEKKLPQDTWDTSDATYTRTDPKTGQWHVQKPPPHQWQIRYHELIFTLRPTEFKHVGVFPEQAPNWNWLSTQIQNQPLKILNLFAYTGGATMAAAQAGAHVTHVDAVRSAISWASSNVLASKLDKKPIRWIEDDAYKFVLREQKRGNLYDGIIMDPPRFGHGAKGELWKLEEDLPRLLHACKTILTKTPSFILINTYTADISSLVLHHMLKDIVPVGHGTLTFGELAIMESSCGRLLPSGIFARWSWK